MGKLANFQGKKILLQVLLELVLTVNVDAVISFFDVQCSVFSSENEIVHSD